MKSDKSRIEEMQCVGYLKISFDYFECIIYN